MGLSGCQSISKLLEPRPQNIVMVVLDTVRADRTSLCGYGRPTTRVLEGLAADGAWSPSG